LFGEDSAHELHQRFSGLLKNESPAASDQESLKLVVSAEIQICRTGVFGLMTNLVSSASSNSTSSFPLPPRLRTREHRPPLEAGGVAPQTRYRNVSGILFHP